MSDWRSKSYAERQVGRRAPTTACQEASDPAQPLGQGQSRRYAIGNLPAGQSHKTAIEEGASGRHQEATVKHTAFAQHLVEDKVLPTSNIESGIIQSGKQL